VGQESLYLGFDCSTQSLTLQVLRISSHDKRIVWEQSLEFDRDLPEFGTRHGVLPSNDPRTAQAPPLMWAAALDRLLGGLAASGLDCSRIAAVSGSAQQHGSVYVNDRFIRALEQLDPARPLIDQLADVLARPVAPIWKDRTTTEECREIADALGGPVRLAQMTGSRAFERFTGPQIRRFARQDPSAYDATARVHLVSSWLASLLVGADAPLDPGDASGMNLMDLSRGDWWTEAVEATAPGLRSKLPAIVPASTVAGTIAPYWRRRHGLPAAHVVVWSGDNPSSLIGTGIIREGHVAMSLGTSDTIFGLMRRARVDDSGTGHVFGAPTGDFMGLTCFQNGSLARDRIRDSFRLDWAGFSRALAATPPGNGGALMLPWFEPEITPDVAVAGVHRVGLAPDDGPANIRAVVEAQMMAMANHSAWMQVEIDTIHATGGGAANRAILQVMADVFGADVYQLEVGNSACLGAALRAWHADARSQGRNIDWPEIVRGRAEPMAASRVAPVGAHVAIYAELRKRYADLERTWRPGL
jgi:xylulokinase